MDAAEALVRSHLGFAHHMARKHAPLSGETYDDLYADALIGLWQAAKRWDDNRNVTFLNYAASRVNGAILDGRRQRDPRSRSGRSDHPYPASLDALTDDDHTIGETLPDPADGIADYLDLAEAEALSSWLARSIGTLDDRTAHVMRSLIAGKSLATIGTELGVTESRACQLKQAALARLRVLARREHTAA